MKIAIMQPYVFPYIGYFQLIKSVDTFVAYDDVNFIKRGWINRNRILLNGHDYLFTVPCQKVSQHKLICDTELFDDRSTLDSILHTIKGAYLKAPHFEKIFPLLEKIFNSNCKFIHELAMVSILEICQYLGIERGFKSSLVYNNRELKSADRLIDICHKEGISNYVNAIGGMEIYTREQFATKNVEIKFLKSTIVPYQQFDNTFIPGLSIIDVLMFNDSATVRKMMDAYELV
jgi:hypothetical protein